MNLDYEKIRAKMEQGGNHWTSYSDLFLVLSITFLLLFVVSNLRSGTVSIATQGQMQAAKAEAEELKRQIKAYEQQRDTYLKTGASQDEVKMYQDLMGKLSLLEDEAGKEKKALFAKAKEAQDKEQSLNHYQELVKNVISANLVASARVKKRDNVIEAKESLISEQEKELTELTDTVAQREAEIAKNNNQIKTIQDDLQGKIAQIKDVFRSKHESEQKLQEAIGKLKSDSEQQISALKGKNSTYIAQLGQTQEKLLEQNRQSERLLNELKEKERSSQETVAALARQHQAALDSEKGAYERAMANAKDANARLKQKNEYLASVEKQNQDYQGRLGALSGELEGTRGKIKDMQGKYQSSMDSLKKSNDTLQKNLTASNNKLNEQRMLAEKINQNFKKAGIHAEIDPKSGDVTVQFGEEYYESGSADLKEGMKKTLEKVIPVYAQSLFQDKKIADRISSVEVVGFASPTYQGKYVNPDSLSLGDRAAVNYNMDLSFRRAKGIFEYIFDTKKMSFEQQRNLLPLVKVSGRSYLATEKITQGASREPGSAMGTVKDPQNYCRQFDCHKTQKVIIKFNLRDE